MAEHVIDRSVSCLLTLGKEKELILSPEPYPCLRIRRNGSGIPGRHRSLGLPI